MNMEDYFISKFNKIGGVKPIAGEKITPLSEDEIIAIENKLGVSLPSSYALFLKKYGAIIFNRYIGFNPIERLPKECSSTGKGLLESFYGSKSSTYDETFSLEWNLNVYRDRMPETLIPIGGDGGGNKICLGISGNERNKIFFWDHDNEWDEEDYLEFDEPVPDNLKFQNAHFIANSFEEFIDILEIHEVDI